MIKVQIKNSIDLNNENILISGEVFDRSTNIKMGDIYNNEITFDELVLLRNYINDNELNLKGLSEEQFYNLIGFSKNFLVFKDINGNFGTNFNIDPEVYQYFY